MSNIGFMEHCARNIQERFSHFMKNSGYPSKQEKEEYKNVKYQLEIMYKYNEIEDTKKYKELMKIIERCDLTRIPELRKKYKKKSNFYGA